MNLGFGLAVAWRLVVSLALLSVIGWWLDGRVIITQLRQLDVRWVGVAVAVSLMQVATSAWRWRYTAGRLGLELSFNRAVREYYLAIFINQLLPGGVVGDVSRAWRHARTEETGPAVRAVILERASGQIVMIAVAVVSCLALPDALRRGVPVGWIATVVLSVAVAALMMWVRRRARSDDTLVDIVVHDIRAALLTRFAFPVQLISSCVIVASYLATFVIAARALGSTTPIATLGPLIPLVLLTMLIPVSIAGWGVREGAAALLWAAAGLSATDGAAISAAYGLLVLLASLPGGLILLSTVRHRRSA